MTRINKNLIIFASLILFLGGSVLISLQKLSPLLSHAIYYCQSIINSISMPIPYYFGAAIFVLAFVFLLIAIIKLFALYIKVQLFRKKLIKNLKSNEGFILLLEKLTLTNKTRLIESEKQFVFCLGIRRPKIYISTNLVNSLTIQELEAVLRHERCHLNNKDTLTMLIASIGESLLPFFPLFSDFLKNFRIEREIQADKEAMQGQGYQEPLISVLKKLLNAPSVATATVPAIADHDTLEPRIRAIVKKDLRFKQFRVKNILISVASIFAMSIIILTPVQAVEVHHMGKDVVMICPHDNTCLNSCKKTYAPTNKNYSEDVMYTPM